MITHVACFKFNKVADFVQVGDKAADSHLATQKLNQCFENTETHPNFLSTRPVIIIIAGLVSSTTGNATAGVQTLITAILRQLWKLKRCSLTLFRRGTPTLWKLRASQVCVGRER